MYTPPGKDKGGPSFIEQRRYVAHKEDIILTFIRLYIKKSTFNATQFKKCFYEIPSMKIRLKILVSGGGRV